MDPFKELVVVTYNISTAEGDMFRISIGPGWS